MQRFATVFLIFLMLWITQITRGNNRNYYYKQITIEQGLSQSGITSILRDHRGLLWVGTRFGLNRLDRNELKSYFHDKEGHNSLPGNYILHLAQDSLHNLWIATDRGLALYDPIQDEFSLFTTELVYSSLCVPGGILLGGRKVIYHYDYATRQVTNLFFRYIEEFNQSEEYDIIDMDFLDLETVLLSTREKGLFLCRLAEHQITPHTLSPLPGLLAVYPDGKSSIYLSIYKKGVYHYDVSGRLIAHYTTENSGLNNDIVLDIIEKEGRIWMATDGGGINLFDPDTRSFTSIEHIPGDATSLPVNSFTVLYNDPDDNLWAGTVRGGLIGIRETYIKTYKDVALGTERGVSDKSVISLFEDRKGLIWIGTDGGGINCYDPQTGLFRHYPHTYGDKVVSITDLSAHELLVSLYGKGVYTFNTETGRYQPFMIINPEINDRECFSGFLPFVHRVSDDKIYIFSRSPIIYYPHEKRFDYIKADEEKINTWALSLIYADDSVAYLKNKNQLFEITGREDSIRLLLTTRPQETIGTACFDGKETLWIGSNEGLSCYNKETGELRSIRTNLFQNVTNLYLDTSGTLWIGAGNMLFSYDPETHRFVIWGESDGFLSNELLFMYQRTSPGEYIYLGGTNGLVKIQAALSVADVTPPQIRLSDIVINGKTHYPEPNKAGSVVKVPWNYNSLSLRVGLNEKDIFLQTLFRYQIEGTGNIRQIESYHHTLDLPLLPPGRYTVTVSCNTKSGEWTPPVTVVQLDVSPPWYKDGRFFTGLFFLVVLAVFYISYLTIRRKERRMRWKMKAYEQNLNEEKIKFLVNISHELRTPLSLIYAPLKRMLNSGQFPDPSLQSQLGGILKQATRMRDIINMVLDLNKAESDFENLQIRSHSLHEWIRSVAGDFRDEADQRYIRIDYQLDETITSAWFDDSKTRIVLYNFLMNALKFSKEHTTITLLSGQVGDHFFVSVRDQGIGLGHTDPSLLFTRFYQGEHNQPGSGIGLAYAKKLIEKQGGVIGARDLPKGAEFFFELPLRPEQTITEEIPIEISQPETTGIIPPEEIDFPTDSYSLLIVEDNDDFRAFLESSLRPLFRRVDTASDGEEALEHIGPHLPDLVVSDVMMPRMNGYELCRRIKTDLEISHIPIILLTARTDDESTRLGYKMGADSYLAKPFDVDTLTTIIRNLLRHKEVIRQKYRHTLHPLSPAETTFSSADERFMNKLNETIAGHIGRPELDVLFLTEEMAMSRASLYNKVKALTDMGVNDYINKLRIERALFLLANTDHTITEVAFETGFAYQRYFSTIFKQVTGMTPSSFRSEKRKVKNEK